MTEPTSETEDYPERVLPAGGRLMQATPSGVQRVVSDVGESGRLLARMVSTAVRQPRGYWAATRDEMYSMLRFCWLPVTLAVGGFTFLIANYAYDLLSLLGAGNRLGTYFVFASIREISPFCTGMAVAGVMGTAMTADLGARRIREELDALVVLGVDALRELVLPRVLAITVMMVLFNILGSVLGIGVALVSATWLGDTSPGAYMGNIFGALTVPELGGTLIKTLGVGLFIGVVAAHKGLTAKGGAEGVGRAVNEAVVLSFAAIWVINFVVNATMLGLFPEMLMNR
ncbi:MlaE family ABC transporter permease [Nocardioides daejeonensis]|uniref:MlaE family ABC transporter permease n=1 Tax=Nocardioides daejeonensis TaxID=1046556 RepID=UPI000D7413A9|nr:ABC transporter permease [Nocardioides daejeonensis]